MAEPLYACRSQLFGGAELHLRRIPPHVWRCREADTLVTWPLDPPAAGPDRGLNPPPPDAARPGVAETDVAVVAVPWPMLAIAPTTLGQVPIAPQSRTNRVLQLIHAGRREVLDVAFALRAPECALPLREERSTYDIAVGG